MCSCLLLSGCGGRELQLFTIATAIAIDRVEDDYSVTIEGSNRISDTTKVIKPSLSSGDGQTVSECLSSIQKSEGRYPYLRHSVLLLISQSALEENLENLVEYVINGHNFRLNSYVAAVKDRAGDLLSDEEYASQKIVRSLSRGANTLTTSDVMIQSLVYDIYAPGIDGFLPIVGPEKTEGVIYLSGFQPAGELDSRMTTAFLLAKGLGDEGNLTVDLGGKPCSFKLTKSRCDRSAEVANGQALLSIELKLRLRAEDRIESIEEAQKEMSQKLKTDIEEACAILREAGSDALGFGQYIYRHDNVLWRQIETEWDGMYKEASLLVKVNVKVDAGPGEERR